MRKHGERGTGELDSGKEMTLTCGSVLSVRGGGARATRAEREREVCGPCGGWRWASAGTEAGLAG